MEHLQQHHHVEDVGRILLQTQDQLRQLREQLTVAHVSSGGANNNAGAEIEEILQRAEDELRMKAELVLNNLVGGGGSRDIEETALPSVHHSHSSHSPSGVRARRRRRVPLLHRGGDADELDLAFFRQRFKSHDADPERVDSPFAGPSRRGGGLAPANRNGKLATHKTTASARLLPYLNKIDPAAPRPALSPVDASQGVLSLLNRGFLPPSVDLTPAFQGVSKAGGGGGGGGGGVISNEAARLYRRDEQPVRAVPYSNPTNYNLANLKFDMGAPSSSVATGAAHASASPQSRALTTVSIHFPSEPSARATQSAGHPDSYAEPKANGSRGAKPGDGDAEAADAGTTESEATSIEDLRKNVDKIRGYNELLDTYSLHQFIIHKGRAMRETPEFQSFRRVAQEIWGSVEEVIRALENLLTRYFVPLAYVDGQRLMAVASMELVAFPTHELLACIVNEDQVASLLRRPGQRYKGKDRKKRAATTLQAFVRMLLHRNRYRRVCRSGASAMCIQRTWRAFASQQKLRQRLAAHREAQLVAWRAQMARLRAQWHEIKQRRRVVVHVPSISLDERARLTMDNFAARQNLQLSRLAGLVDPTVDCIVYVAPFELSADVAQYFAKLLALGGVANPSARLKILFPEHAAQFAAHSSLATHVLYSPHCLRRIRRLVRDREAYLVMGVPGAEDQRLALALQLPLLGLEDPRAAAPLLTRSGAKRFFIKADVNVPVGTYDLYDVDELLFALAKLIISHLEQNAWLLRLDADALGTGTALLDVSTLSTLRDIRREKKAPEYWKQPGIRDTVARALLQELEREIVTLARPSHPEIYGSWAAFARAIAHFGVVVEALPAHVVGVVRANMFVEPSGDVHVMSTQDVLAASGGASAAQRRRRPVAFAFPQTLVPHDALVGAAQAVGRQLVEVHAFCGYASVDLQLFRDETTAASRAPERLWAVALHPFLTDSAATFATFHALHGGSLNASTGLYHLSATAAPESPSVSLSLPLPARGASDALVLQEAQLLASAVGSLARTGAARCFVAVDYVFHPNVCTMPYAAFFHTCRLHGVCFDVERCVGSIFQLVDSLTAGVFGVLSSGETAAQAAQYLRTAFEVIGREVGTQSHAPVAAASDDGDDGAVVQPSGNFAEVLGLLRHRVVAEKEREKEKRETTIAAAVTTVAMGVDPRGATADATPLLRVGKVDQLKRMRRTSQ